MITRAIEQALSITGLGILTALGQEIGSQLSAIERGQTNFRPLSELLGRDNPHGSIRAGWIESRSLLTSRKWSPASMAALYVAREAVTAAKWSADDLRDAAVVLGTSRGNAAGWLAPWPGRRPFKLMAASNTIHSEPAAAITIELGIRGPYQVLASGCSAGLDAIGIAALLIQSGIAPRAIAVAVDLPLVPCLLDSYAHSGLLSRRSSCDPYSPESDGFLPAEGAAAMTLEPCKQGFPSLLGYTANSDAGDPLGMPKDGGRSIQLIQEAIARHGLPSALCPHATGTAVHAISEPAALKASFSGPPHPSLHLLKPFTGHTIGASGLVEAAILTSFLARGKLPPNLAGRSSVDGFHLPDTSLDASGPLFKLSHSMGGHNALLVLSPP